MCIINDQISAWNAGDEQSLDKLITITYQRLRQSAKYALGDVGGDHSLQATELVNELYCHLKKYRIINCRGSAEYFGIVSWRLRDILKKKIRGKYARKRDFGFKDDKYDIENITSSGGAFQSLIITKALDFLREIDTQTAQIAELHTFWEFSVPEICNIVEISESTYHRKWRHAKVLLGQYLSDRS